MTSPVVIRERDNWIWVELRATGDKLAYCQIGDDLAVEHIADILSAKHLPADAMKLRQMVRDARRPKR